MAEIITALGLGGVVFLLIIGILFLIMPFYIININGKLNVLERINKNLTKIVSETYYDGGCEECERYKKDGEKQCFWCKKVF